MLAKMGGSRINTQILRARIADSRSAWIAAVAIPLMLLAPALWNGYPLLQWDTGGYLARWYEGYLVPSRSTVFGLYLHFGEDSVLDQSRDPGAGDAVDPAADAARARHGPAVAAAGDQPRADPDHRAALARQHAADRHLCRALGAVAFHPGRAWRADFGNRKMLAVRLHRLCRGDAQRHAGGAARTVLRRLDRASVSARADRRCRTGAGQPDHRRRRGDAAVGEFRVVGTIGVDARRLRRRVRTDAAGWHRRALSARSLSAAEAEALPLSRSSCRPPPISSCGATACSTRSAASRA